MDIVDPGFAAPVLGAVHGHGVMDMKAALACQMLERREDERMTNLFRLDPGVAERQISRTRRRVARRDAGDCAGRPAACTMTPTKAERDARPRNQ